MGPPSHRLCLLSVVMIVAIGYSSRHGPSLVAKQDCRRRSSLARDGGRELSRPLTTARARHQEPHLPILGGASHRPRRQVPLHVIGRRRRSRKSIYE
ncbi:hypothetical protein B0J13DRAFT_134147 [Dactylonectria estremocensis]|uniref:Secreted protein n=1 Tax=Dactylonectria estremocensis TaxID=1079267 RepID=A0A9P9E216_9HYPO|nr:hypothetical protein B0J13DRAFT_134147 [Dactylonectria estremocensis]